MPTGLIRRGARYAIRRRIPVDVLHHYPPSQKEVTRALGTADPKLARRLLPLKWAELDREFDAVRKQIATAPPKAAALTRSSGPASKAVDYWGSMSREQWDYEMDALEWSSRENSREEFEREEREELERKIVALAEGPADGLTPEQLAMRDLLRDAKFYRDLAEERLSIASSQAKRKEREAANVGGPRLPETLPKTGPATALDAIVDKWAAERRRDVKSVETHRSVATWFVERTKVAAVEQVTRKDVLAFKDKLLAEGQSAANVKVKLSRLRTLLNYAVSNDYIAESPAKGVSVLVSDADKTKRRPFDRTALAAIFGGPVYTNDARPVQGKGEAAYWLPLLALYTGARMEELGQLRVGDVREEAYPDADDAEQRGWFIHVTEDAADDMKLKNAGSERVIPVHAILEQLGFTRFVEAAGVARQVRLFPALRPNKHGRLTAKWGEWFSRYKRECGVTDKRMVFHSFRHTFKDNGRGRMSDGVQRQIMGHSSGDVADSYGTGFSVWQLVEGMQAYRVPGFTPPPPPPSFRAGPRA